MVSGNASQSAYPITDIKVDRKDKTVFVAIGDEIYAQRYYIKSFINTVPIEDPTHEDIESNPQNRESVYYLTPIWPRPIRVFTSTSNSSVPGIQSITLDTEN